MLSFSKITFKNRFNNMEIRIKACNEFVLGHYRKLSDAKPAKSFSEEQIMNALNKSKSFNVRDWFGSTILVTFTITNIERTECGKYIYTIKSSRTINKDYFPSVLDICQDCDNVASPLSYSIL